MRISFLVILTVCYSHMMVSQTVVSIPATKDCGLYETTDGSLSNGVGQFLFVGKLGANGSEKKRRALVQFDLTGKIPSGAQVESVKIVINVSKVNNTTVQPTNVFRVSAAWGEGTSNGGSNGQGATSTTNDATWIHSFFNTVNWTTPGGDFSGTASSSVGIGNIGVYTFNSTSTLVSDVQGWVQNSSTNFGWVIKGDEVDPKSMKVIDSRENTATGNRPVLVVKYSGSTGVQDRAITPGIFSLQQNYPNPFNPSTTIRYSVPAAGVVSLKVFDLLGKEIATLVNETKAQGSFSREWDASGLPSGMYFYRLQSGNHVSTKKLLLTK